MGFDWRGFMFGGAGQAPDPNASRFQDRDYLLQQAQRGIQSAQNRQAPQANRTTVGQVSQFGGPADVRGMEMGMVRDLGAIASGQQMGAGELGVRRAGQQAMGNAIGSATMARGANAAGGARAAARAAAGIGMGVAGQSQQAALGDQQAARAQQAALLGQTGARDTQIGLANMDAANQRVFQQAGLDQATSLANMQARLQAIGMNDAAILGYMGQLTGMNQAELAARMGQEQTSLGSTGVFPYVLQAAAGVGAAAAGAPGACDERLKENVDDGRVEARAFMDSLRPVTFEYKDPERFGEGRRLGVMAQDVERSEVGRAIVMETPDGKMLDVTRLVVALTASVAELNRRLERLESKQAA